MTIKARVGLTVGDHQRLQTIVDASTDNFLHLVKAAGLDKSVDFIGMSFAGMSLDGLELEGFNFDGADFCACSLVGTTFVDCSLKGAAFNFPPQIRDKWRTTRGFFLGRHDARALELMQEATEASQRGERKRAITELLELREGNNSETIDPFLQRVCLKDKAKSLRRWLKLRLTDNLKRSDDFRAILERSLFEGGEDLNEDIVAYVRLLEGNDEAVETLRQACGINPRAIKQATRELGENKSFQRFLINTVAFSDGHSAWREAAMALCETGLGKAEKRSAFIRRLARIGDRHDLCELTTAAALNAVDIPRLFELSEIGYRNESDVWLAEDFLLYCYYYDTNKYHNDVLYYSFHEGEGPRQISAESAFAAYCFVHQTQLYWSATRERSYFYIDPRALIGKKPRYFIERYSEPVANELEQLAKFAFEQSSRIQSGDLIRPLAVTQTAAATP